MSNNNKHINIAFSSCPNDTFIFYALVHEKIDVEGFCFNYEIKDIEQLNNDALANKHDIVKISYQVYPDIIEKYVLMNSGSALGQNCGPILISNRIVSLDEVSNLTIAIPGRNTTAFLLLKTAFPRLGTIKEMIFSDIEDAVLSGEVDAGLIIHESRFTYEEKGLQKILDLGEHWNHIANLPIPLGGIVVNRDLPIGLQQKLNELLYKSIQFAFESPESVMGFVRENAREMDDDVIKKHLQTYVNDYTINLGVDGKEAITTLYKKTLESSFFERIRNSLFL